jgi:hypothetical protein
MAIFRTIASSEVPNPLYFDPCSGLQDGSKRFNGSFIQ